MGIEATNMTVFLGELTRYFGRLQYATIHTDSPLYF